MVDNNNIATTTTTRTYDDDDKRQTSSVLSIQNLLSPIDEGENQMTTTTTIPTLKTTRRSRAKTKRKRASPSQLAVLNQVFNQTYFPSTELRTELGKQLGMNPRTVQIWFQNKRQALRARDRACRQQHLTTATTPMSPPLSPNHAISLPPLRLTLASSSPVDCFPCHSPISTLPSPSSMVDLNPLHY
ncbi:hypothetical protein O0I10_004982 [Lichtheimia ornata]|uniref:Homeobox domain-containing protein n=1 Tax=Lichtheimia ornata TaxID=688661 RepID=A0AAD7V4M0_9FUNG|nr:uncharacterized protein O0I10_004982 [Lichtheimia ornata]KAJ8659268.1 hypothetical protein O0I10_004982 [Lichtheimia ornata]